MAVKISQKVTNKLTRRFYEKGFKSVSDWARKRGFSRTTVFHIIHGGKTYTGKHGEVGLRIHAALIEDKILRPTKKLLRDLGIENDAEKEVSES